MDALEPVIKLMRPGYYMTSIDLKNAYDSIPIGPEHQKYLKGSEVSGRIRSVLSVVYP